MGVIRRTPTSRRDYREIWEYVAARNLDAADELLRMFEAALELLSNHPRAGPQRPELGTRLRSYPVGNYLIFDRPARGGIHLVRVVHGARDLRRIFKRHG